MASSGPLSESISTVPPAGTSSGVAVITFWISFVSTHCISRCDTAASMICGSATSGLSFHAPPGGGAGDEKRVRPRHLRRRRSIVDHQVPRAQVDLVQIGLGLEKTGAFHADLGHFGGRFRGQHLFQPLVLGRDQQHLRPAGRIHHRPCLIVHGQLVVRLGLQAQYARLEIVQVEGKPLGLAGRNGQPVGVGWMVVSVDEELQQDIGGRAAGAGRRSFAGGRRPGACACAPRCGPRRS